MGDSQLSGNFLYTQLELFIDQLGVDNEHLGSAGGITEPRETVRDAQGQPDQVPSLVAFTGTNEHAGGVRFQNTFNNVGIACDVADKEITVVVQQAKSEVGAVVGACCWPVFDYIVHIGIFN